MSPVPLEEQMLVFLKTGDRLTFTELLNAFSFDLQAYHENFDHWLAAKLPQYYRELREFDETLLKADALLSEAARLVAH